MAQGFALLNADIWTMKAPQDRAEALLVDHGRIQYVGSEATVLRKARALGVPEVDLEGARVLPGLIDSHAHLVHHGIFATKTRIDLEGTKSLEQALALIAKRVKTTKPGELVLAERFDESFWKERRWPTKADLDAISTKHHIVARRVDGHAAVANTMATEHVATQLKGVDKEQGLLLEEASLDLHNVYPTPVATAVDASLAAQQDALTYGLTTIHDFVYSNYFRAWQELDRKNSLALRIVATPYVETLKALSLIGFESGFGHGRLRLGGVKVFADGSIGAHTAALSEGYGDVPSNRGRFIWDDGALQGHLDMAQDANLQISVHAIGDAAIDQVLKGYKGLPKKDRRRLRHRIEHFELGHPEQWEAAKELRLVLSMQPNFVGEWGLPGGMYAQRLGSPRHKENNLFRKIHDAGLPLAFGSDCMPLDPWFGLQSVVDAPYPAQRLKIEEALTHYTKGSAWGLHMDTEVGTLQKGKWADLAIVEGDWRKPGGVAKTKVLATTVGGRFLHLKRKPKIRPQGATLPT
jgi:predicted amidohydrolase YtcJ